LEYFRYCLDKGGNEVAALAMYNAGPGRVSGIGTPRITLDYISRIQKDRDLFEDEFKEEILDTPFYLVGASPKNNKNPITLIEQSLKMN
jgi:hypothetical protein